MTRWGNDPVDYPDWKPDPLREFAGCDYPDEEEGIPEHVFISRLRTWAEYASSNTAAPDPEAVLREAIQRHSPRFVAAYERSHPKPSAIVVRPDPVEMSVSVAVTALIVEHTTRLAVPLRNLRWFVPKSHRASVDEAAHDLAATVREMRERGCGRTMIASYALIQTVRTAGPFVADAATFLIKRVGPIVEWVLRIRGGS